MPEASAWAHWYATSVKGKKVGGYDRTPSELTEKLIEEGASYPLRRKLRTDNGCIPRPINYIVVYTPAVPDTHKEFTYFRENGFEIHKRSQVLGMLTHAGKGLCVAGTHGKTTTSTATAHLLHQSHVGCNAFLGGISKITAPTCCCLTAVNTWLLKPTSSTFFPLALRLHIGDYRNRSRPSGYLRNQRGLSGKLPQIYLTHPAGRCIDCT